MGSSYQQLKMAAQRYAESKECLTTFTPEAEGNRFELVRIFLSHYANNIIKERMSLFQSQALYPSLTLIEQFISKYKAVRFVYEWQYLEMILFSLTLFTFSFLAN